MGDRDLFQVMPSAAGGAPDLNRGNRGRRLARRALHLQQLGHRRQRRQRRFLLQPRRCGGGRQFRRRRLRDELPGHFPVRDRGRRHLVEEELRYRAGLVGGGVVRRRFGLLVVRGQAVLAARHRLLRAECLRRLGGRRPRHRRRGLRHLRAGRLVRGRRYQRLVPADRRCLRPGRSSRRSGGLGRVRPCRKPQRHHVGLQRFVQRVLPVQRGSGLRRPDRPGNTQRSRSFQRSRRRRRLFRQDRPGDVRGGGQVPGRLRGRLGERHQG
ncbi:hypothetical protein SCOCK_20022 [Actinacidiphila cocklensis]|uniref:Uncharacterized protein n=1 Tax=Actinacidiphila cocklensis TaxID=887465 RepID=A0A9W4DT13_9ACTN|nr:hypothetical protein SCOCK_20022 [Actinacidiphila cocklensis]